LLTHSQFVKQHGVNLVSFAAALLSFALLPTVRTALAGALQRSKFIWEITTRQSQILRKQLP
jgi:hypothetical protein